MCIVVDICCGWRVVIILSLDFNGRKMTFEEDLDRVDVLCMTVGLRTEDALC